MKSFNWKYMRRRGATDILSFPTDDFSRAAKNGNLLGDLLICLEKVQAQARSHRRPLRDELGQVLIHGILHLEGYDHQTPRELKVMREIEQEILPQVSPHLSHLCE